jgi:protein-S-isoprenylcysteine O-methyltransferase Ste14
MKRDIDQLGRPPASEHTRRALSIAGSAVFLVIAPGVVAGLAPWWLTHWRAGPPVFGSVALRGVGVVLIGLGALGLLDSFARFAVQGLGTPAPVFPTRRLIVSGLYRYVRNPMYVAVVSAILGQGLWFGSPTLVAYGAIVWSLSHLFVVLYEEPKLKASFGADYEVFRAHVPRWIPRIASFSPPPDG